MPDSMPRPSCALALAVAILTVAWSRAPSWAEASRGAADPTASAVESRASDAAWAPAADTLARLRAVVGRRPIQLWSGTGKYEVRGARLDSSGVCFDPGGVRAAWDPDGGGSPPLTSPLAWSHVRRIETTHSHGLIGTAVGAAVGLLAMSYVMAATDYYEDEFMIFIEVPGAFLVPTLLGTLIGVASQGRAVVWKQPEGAGGGTH